MNKILAIIILIILTSCDSSNVKSGATRYRVGKSGRQLLIMKIEDCEYFYAEHGHSVIFCHKGNCMNSIHKIK